MKTRFLAMALLGAAGLFGQVSLGIRIGPPPAPRMMRMQPRAPGPEHVWVDGYWYADGRRWRWHDGYWTRVPFGGARWVSPRYDGGQFYQGFWDRGDQGRFDHDHRWDRDRRNRDYRDRP